MTAKPDRNRSPPAQPEHNDDSCAEMPSPAATQLLDHDDTNGLAARQPGNMIQAVAQIAILAEQQGLHDTALLLHETARAIRAQLASGT